jgi:NADPH:quinone reductase
MEARRLVSRLERDGSLTVFLETVDVPQPGATGLLVRVDAAPVNPADVKAMFCGIAPDALQTERAGDELAVRGKVSPRVLQANVHRIGKTMAPGIEGTGQVIAAGSASEALAMLGKKVAFAAPGTFGDVCAVEIDDCMVLSHDTRPEVAAAAWINPMTALAMVATMRKEGHRALVLTAAASNLGKMLNRLCLEDAIPLVNIVRSQDAASVLRSMGAQHVCNSSDADFDCLLVDALAETGATLAFDATGGGCLAGKIMAGMEKAATRNAPETGRYGSSVYKQLYFFGGLDPSPLTIERSFGMAWGMGGWLLQPVLSTFDPETVSAMKARVRDDLGTTFSSAFDRELSLQDMLLQTNIAHYARLGTGGKALVRP